LLFKSKENSSSYPLKPKIPIGILKSSEVFIGSLKFLKAANKNKPPDCSEGFDIQMNLNYFLSAFAASDSSCFN
jgi:hypothetical protein